MDLFKIIPENFFTLLASKNKRLYLGAIFEAFRIYEDGSILGIDKKIVLDVLTTYCEKNNEEDLEIEEEDKSSRAKANFLLRKLEECGWIDIDITNDYDEILNFRDYAIQIIEAFQNVIPSYEFYDELNSVQSNNRVEYRGYIYTIYSILCNNTSKEYGVIMEQVYRNTKLFIRELRKLDARLKEYIKSIVENVEIKDLMDTLINYKTELVDKSYQRLKTSDNVNKYRLFIVNELEKIQDTADYMDIIARHHMLSMGDYESAYKRANRDINEIIDIFNSLDSMIDEIDLKNKTYVNSTIGKIKFLLSEEDNTIGKLNAILKFIKIKYKEDKINEAINIIAPLYSVSSTKTVNDASLYQPRGSYQHIQNYFLETELVDFTSIQQSFFKEYEAGFKESELLNDINELMHDDCLYASDIIHYDSSDEDILKALYALIYANAENNLKVSPMNERLSHKKFSMHNFKIEKEITDVR